MGKLILSYLLDQTFPYLNWFQAIKLHFKNPEKY